ncbi:MAG: hypothetical protein IH898_08690, partial [Planctomycetes bacterium]|nr:hypothetical protein [Planctomycetota bacterium]
GNGGDRFHAIELGPCNKPGQFQRAAELAADAEFGVAGPEFEHQHRTIIGGRQTADDAVFIFVKPRVLSLFTNRQAAVYHWTQGETGLLRFMEEIHADYAVTTQVFGQDLKFFQPFKNWNRSVLLLVKQNFGGGYFRLGGYNNNIISSGGCQR